MKSISIALVAWYVFPIVLLFACSYLVSAFSLTEKYKLKAPDLAVPFLFIGLGQVTKITFDYSVVPLAILAALLIGIAVSIFQARYFGDIKYFRFFKMLWRIIFLYSLSLYIILSILSFISHIK